MSSSSTELKPYNQNNFPSFKSIGKLLALYYFLDHYLSLGATIDEVLFAKFNIWTSTQFWSSVTFIKYCKTYVKSPVDSKNRVLTSVSEHSEDLARHNVKKRIPLNKRKGYEPSEKHKSDIAKAIRDHLQKNLLWRSTETQTDVMRIVMRKIQLDSWDCTEHQQMQSIIQNISTFFDKTAKFRRSEVLNLRDAVRSIISGPQSDPTLIKQIISEDTVKLSSYRQAKIRREIFEDSLEIKDLIKHERYIKKCRFPIKVKCEIVKYAEDWSFPNPSVEKIVSWNDPRSLSLVEDHLMHWSNFSRKKLANLILTVHSRSLEVAMGNTKSKYGGVDQNVPSQRYVENVLSDIPWLKTSRQFYGAYFCCGKCTTWEKNVDSLYHVVTAAMENFDCGNYQCCNSPDDQCLLSCQGYCICSKHEYYRALLPRSSKLFALRLLCTGSDFSEDSITGKAFQRKCWTGECGCFQDKISNLFSEMQPLFKRNQKIDFFEYVEKFRNIKSNKKQPFKYHGYDRTHLSVLQYKKNLIIDLKIFLPHLIALNWTNKHLGNLTNFVNPLLPVNDILLGFDFSQSPKFIRAGMSQVDYQEGQQFGLFSFIALWSKYVEGRKVIRKAVFMVIFKDYKHSTSRAIQSFSLCIKKLIPILRGDDIELKSLIVYSDNAGGDQKNRFMMDFFSCFSIHEKGIPRRVTIRYFQRPADHNKWLFDSEGGLFKRCYLKAALNRKNTALQWNDIGGRNTDHHLRVIRDFMNGSVGTDWYNFGKRKGSSTFWKECVYDGDVKKSVRRSVKYFLPKTMSNFCFYSANEDHKMVFRHLPCFCIECLKYYKTPNCANLDFCGEWTPHDFMDDVPTFTSPNKTERVGGKFPRDRKFKYSLRHTPIWGDSAPTPNRNLYMLQPVTESIPEAIPMSVQPFIDDKKQYMAETKRKRKKRGKPRDRSKRARLNFNKLHTLK